MKLLMWLGFFTFIAMMIALDMKVFHRKARIISIRESLAWTFFWFTLALAFTMAVYEFYNLNWFGDGFEVGLRQSGYDAALQFLTGFLIEKSLSVDLIIIIALIFSYYGIPLAFQFHLLYWSVIAALVLRGIMIAGGSLLINRFHWSVYLLGILLIVTAVKLLIVRHDNLVPERNILVMLARRLFPGTPNIRGEQFFERVDGRWAMTPLFLVFLVIQSANFLFSIDAIPAIFAVTWDPFIVFTANAFAVLGLIPLYFTLACYLDRLQYFKMSLVFVLTFVAVKMFLMSTYHFPTSMSLAVIGGFLLVGTVASFFSQRRDTAPLLSPVDDELSQLAWVTLRQAWRVIILIIGASVVLVGIAMIVLPGPAFIVIPMGLGILATEFVWARRLLKTFKGKALSLIGRTATDSSDGTAAIPLGVNDHLTASHPECESNDDWSESD